MIFTVAGLMNTILAKPVISIVARGTNTLHRVDSAKAPWIPDCVPRDFEAGYVKAKNAGSAVCMPKYMGNSLCWKVANWGRGSDLKATTPPIKL